MILAELQRCRFRFADFADDVLKGLENLPAEPFGPRPVRGICANQLERNGGDNSRIKSSSSR
ncbi:hypothetical protein NKJ36_10060 [Mesorhizobium sp. M0142]|uniref:hypothetical protein n=1 Tax=unclassified Mesorhizobium TaxID=325217 RepID=UPI003335A546